MPGKGRGRRFWTMIIALVLAVAVLAISGIIHARLDSQAQDLARQNRSDIERGVAVASSASKAFVNTPYAGAIVGGAVALVILGIVLAIPFSRFSRRLTVGVCAVTLAAAATHMRWERPLVQIDYVGREASGQVRATYTLIPWSPMQRDSGLDRKEPGASRLIDQIEQITSHLPIREAVTRKDTMSAAQIASVLPRLAELTAVFPQEVEAMQAALKKAAESPDTLTRTQLRKTLDAEGKHKFVMGTDAFGQDVLSQVMHSCRLAISIGLVSTGVALLIGVTLGAIMGYFGGAIDLLLYRVVEIFMAVPVLFLLIVAVAVLPEELRNTYVIMAIIGCFTWTGMARFTRAEFMKLRNQDFVQAARSAGLPLRSILFKHMLPNGVAPVLVDSSFAIAAAISVEAVLSYLGLGPVDSASWGKLLSSAISTEGEFKWWLAVFPGAAIFFTVLSYNLIGEALRDAIDPKLKKARV
ncbi:MAG: ABC transporter permease [Pyrinomonadaceae bacterium]|nr:ABC transporter permease [Phycisphaerales bacterium]